MFVSKSSFRLMDDWRNIACRAHESNKELLQLAQDVNETNKRCIAYNEQLSRELGIARSDIDQLVYKLECLLDHASGSRLSKHTHDLRIMESAVNEHIEKLCSETYAEAKNEVIDEFANRLKEKMNDLSRMEYDCKPYFLVSKSFIDKIAEEMKGGE